MKDPHDIRKAAIEDELIARSEEASTVLSAWQSAFGTTRLSHAIAERDRWKEAAIRDDQEFKKALVERDQLRAKCERLEAQLEESFKGILCIRCTKHANITPYNTREINGGECPACEIEQLRQDRDHLDQQHRTLLQDKNALQSVIEQCEVCLRSIVGYRTKEHFKGNGPGAIAGEFDVKDLHMSLDALAAIKKVKEGK